MPLTSSSLGLSPTAALVFAVETRRVAMQEKSFPEALRAKGVGVVEVWIGGGNTAMVLVLGPVPPGDEPPAEEVQPER